MTSAETLPRNELPGIVSFWSTGVAAVKLNGQQCLIFTICVYLIKSCNYTAGTDVDLAASYFVVAACSSL